LTLSYPSLGLSVSHWHFVKSISVFITWIARIKYFFFSSSNQRWSAVLIKSVSMATPSMSGISWWNRLSIINCSQMIFASLLEFQEYIKFIKSVTNFFGPISTNSLTISTVLTVPESSYEDLLVNTKYFSRKLILVKLLGKSVDNYHNTIRGFHLGLQPFLNPLLILCY